MRRHMRRWGAVYLLATIFTGSWIGQFVAQGEEIAQKGATEFWAATFENWQSEFLQLAVQAIVIVGAARLWFRVSKEDVDDLRDRLDRMERMLRKDERG